METTLEFLLPIMEEEEYSNEELKKEIVDIWNSTIFKVRDELYPDVKLYFKIDAESDPYRVVLTSLDQVTFSVFSIIATNHKYKDLIYTE